MMLDPNLFVFLVFLMIRFNNIAQTVGFAWENTVVPSASSSMTMSEYTLLTSLLFCLIIDENFCVDQLVIDKLGFFFKVSKNQYHCDGCGICRFGFSQASLNIIILNPLSCLLM